ncbi:MAG: hypothetical protein DMF88_10545 [Acidobacteria bacterium]|nr:MAG: hypothetical protein DMF88_10545 [Acidobacteriota bacterium]
MGRPLLAAASIAQTIPSLALLGFLLPLPFIGGIGPRIAIVALILYALLPIVRSTAAGLKSIDPAVIDAAVAMGMTRRQLLWLVELPLALPSIVASAPRRSRRRSVPVALASTSSAASRWSTRPSSSPAPSPRRCSRWSPMAC